MKLPQCKKLSAAGGREPRGINRLLRFFVTAGWGQKTFHFSAISSDKGEKVVIAARESTMSLKGTGGGDMKIADVLRKLGILRYGVKTGTYTGMKDRPAEFFMEGVFNAEKDLVNQEDVKNAAAAVKSLGGRKVLFWAAVGLGAFVLLILAAGSGFTAWFFADLILWGGFIAVLRQFAYRGR